MAEVSQVAVDAVQFYRSKGISKDAAVAIVSVLWYESKLRPGSQGSQSTETPGTLNPGGAYGIASWNGPRQAALASYASKRGLNVGDLNTQLAFVLTEMANSYPKSWAAVTSAQAFAQIIPVIVAEYENPKDHQAEINGAMTLAPQLYGVIPPAAPKPAWPTTSTTVGVLPMPPIDPAFIAALAQLLAPIAESIFAGVVKGISQHVTTAQTSAAPAPAFDPAALAKLIVAEMAALQGGTKQ